MTIHHVEYRDADGQQRVREVLAHSQREAEYLVSLLLGTGALITTHSL